MMQIFVKTLTGKTLTINVSKDTTVEEIKLEIKSKSGIPIKQQRLIYGCKQLQNNLQLYSDYNVEHESTLHLLIRLLGGPKKGKKKNFAKPKKQKHKRKKIPMAVLKYYGIDGDGKLQRLRKTCNEDMCGPGVRMAMHYDRFYCGKCHLTVSIKKAQEKTLR